MPDAIGELLVSSQNKFRDPGRNQEAKKRLCNFCFHFNFSRL